MSEKEKFDYIKDFNRMSEQPMMVKARKIANNLYKEYTEEGKRQCNNLLLEWIKECFWGRVTKDHLPIFDEVWQLLDEGKYTKKNPFIYGDIDEGVWIERPKSKYKKVIVSERYCACRDDNIFIFIKDDSSISFDTFRVATVWHREKKYSLKSNYGDDRDIKLPSLNTYKKRDFYYGYYDCRDKGHVLKYDSFTERVEKANWSENEIPWALDTLRSHLLMLKEKED